MSSKSKQQGDQQVNMKYVTLVSMVAAIGGLLLGFDTAVVAGAIGFMKQHFDLNEMQVGWAVSCLIIGCIAGAASAGVLGERFGRKKILITAAILFIIGSIGAALPDTFNQYIVFRIIGGVGIGLTSTLCPLYNAEIAPAKYRGRLVALNQLATVTGIFLVYFTNLGIAELGDEAWGITTAWRWMFAFNVVPGALFLVLLFIVPESPRWLIKHGKAAEALPILLRIHGETLAKQEVLDIKASFKEDNSGSLRQLFSPGIRIALIVGVGLAVLQQVTGINAVMYYAPEIFKETGAGTNAALIQTILVGLINFLFTILAIWLIDKVGRKILLLIGSSIMTLSLAIIGLAFHSGSTSGPVVLIFILVYVAAFAVSLGPVVWVLISEIFPNHIRAKATAIASMALWIGNYIVSQSFPPMLASAGPAITFWIFGILSLITFVFTWRVVPETKGKSLEDIESLWAPEPQQS